MRVVATLTQRAKLLYPSHEQPRILKDLVTMQALRPTVWWVCISVTGFPLILTPEVKMLFLFLVLPTS